jgi:hypothetical protein
MFRTIVSKAQGVNSQASTDLLVIRRSGSGKRKPFSQGRRGCGCFASIFPLRFLLNDLVDAVMARLQFP